MSGTNMETENLWDFVWYI